MKAEINRQEPKASMIKPPPNRRCFSTTCRIKTSLAAIKQFHEEPRASFDVSFASWRERVAFALPSLLLYLSLSNGY